MSKKIERINLFTLGNSSVGKSCFIERYTKDVFRLEYISTIGFDFRTKNQKLPDGSEYKICFYDTAGQEKYRSIAFNAIKNADGILVMYDITNQISFDTLEEWIKSIFEAKDENFPIVLVGNKCDLEKERVISKEEGEKEAKKHNFSFFETSNKEGINIEETVIELIQKIVEKKKKEEEKNQNQNKKIENKSMKLEVKKTKKRKCHC